MIKLQQTNATSCDNRGAEFPSTDVLLTPGALAYIATLHGARRRINMARKVSTVVEMTDDLDGGKADQTVRFAFDGRQYEIDLSRKNANALQRALTPYLDHGRRVRAARSRGGSAGKSTKRADAADVRTWAKASGYQISDRGRIPGDGARSLRREITTTRPSLSLPRTPERRLAAPGSPQQHTMPRT
jgi:Lsr2